jgi:S1-C subfamily serine protease
VIAVAGGDSTTTITRTVAATSRPVANVSSSGSAGRLDAESLYAASVPGVVEITSKLSSGDSSATPAPGAPGFGNPGTPGAPTPGAPFGQPGTPESTPEATATGSGFIVDGEGTVVTAAHVVDKASSVRVTLQDGTSRAAKVLGVDNATDLAVIRFDASELELHPLELGRSADLAVGAEVAAIGAPFNFAWSLSTGIVSGLDRTIGAPNGFTVAHAIQTDAAVNPGNSGGPLLNEQGEVIGVVDQIASSADQSSGVGFAVPSDLVSSEIKALANGEEVEHAYLGVGTGSATGPVSGAEIQQVVPGSPADKGGLEAGDVITSFDGQAIADSEDLVAAIGEGKPGDKVQLEVHRGSQTKSLVVTLGSQPSKAEAG